MDLTDTQEEAGFRTDVRAWLQANAPGDLGELSSPSAIRDLRDEAAARVWSRALAEAGYAGLTWPEAYGGRGTSYSYQAIFLEEAAQAEAPQHLGVIGLGMAGPTIIEHGTDEQKVRHLRSILTADEIWCQGFSEPGAGSDLAAIRTKAVLTDDRFVVDGQKVWSSFAQIADWCLLLARSDPATTAHRGLTMLLVDMRSPGVEVRPIRELSGDSVFNEVFFTGVEVPAANALGAVGSGWSVAMTTLLHERGTLGFSLLGALEVGMRRLLALAREREVTDPRLCDLIAREWIELQALKLTNYRFLARPDSTGVPGPEASVIKLRWSQANQRLTSLALEIHGAEAAIASEEWRYQQLRSRANTIEAGTSEILSNILAERVLGLPRSR